MISKYFLSQERYATWFIFGFYAVGTAPCFISDLEVLKPGVCVKPKQPCTVSSCSRAWLHLDKLACENLFHQQSYCILGIMLKEIKSIILKESASFSMLGAVRRWSFSPWPTGGIRMPSKKQMRTLPMVTVIQVAPPVQAQFIHFISSGNHLRYSRFNCYYVKAHWETWILFKLIDMFAYFITCTSVGS